MKEIKKVFKQAEFVDYRGRANKFIVCALSFAYDRRSTINSMVLLPTKDSADTISVNKFLTLGVAFCHQNDEFDPAIGEKIAYEKALNAANSGATFLATNEPGMINEDTVTAFVDNKIKYIQKDPGSLIAGYDEARRKYEERLLLEKNWEEATEEEKAMAKTLCDFDASSPEVQDRIMNLIEYTSRIKPENK